ncbi:MAG: hypothetical protein ACI8UO_001324 [Verrucomicrobiales bacterium]|jgi:hypothetical protein
MREIAKSMISFSFAVGMAGARGVLSLANPHQRERFIRDSQGLLHRGTKATIDTLGRDFRETFAFADDFQRRTIDAISTTAKAVTSKARPTTTAEANPPEAQ